MVFLQQIPVNLDIYFGTGKGMGSFTRDNRLTGSPGNAVVPQMPVMRTDAGCRPAFFTYEGRV